MASEEVCKKVDEAVELMEKMAQRYGSVRKGWQGSSFSEQEVESFTVLIDDNEMEIKRRPDGAWIERGAHGEKRYMSYLKPSDILNYIRRDFPDSDVMVIAVNGEEV